MDRDTAVRMAQDAIKAKNKRLIDQVLQIKAERQQGDAAAQATGELPLIGVTCSTGWECYAVVEELVKTGRFRVRAMYRTPGTQAAERLETLHRKTEAEQPGLLTLKSGVDMNSAEILTEAFKDCDGIVLYMTANTAKAGKITNHGKRSGQWTHCVHEPGRGVAGGAACEPVGQTCDHAGVSDRQGHRYCG